MTEDKRAARKLALDDLRTSVKLGRDMGIPQAQTSIDIPSRASLLTVS